MHAMSLLCFAADAIRSGRWLIFFKDLTVSIAICTVFLDFINVCLGLSSVADFSNTGAELQLQLNALLVYPHKG